jgi:hypothetical protein
MLDEWENYNEKTQTNPHPSGLLKVNVIIFEYTSNLIAL